MLTQNRCEPNDLGMQGMCGHKEIGIWEVSNITVVDSNDIKPAVTIVALCVGIAIHITVVSNAE